MKLKAAMKILEKDAEFCGLEFQKYLGTVAMHRGAFPSKVLEAFDVWAEHKRQEKLTS